MIVEQSKDGRNTFYLHEVEIKEKARSVFKTATERGTLQAEKDVFKTATERGTPQAEKDVFKTATERGTPQKSKLVLIKKLQRIISKYRPSLIK